MTKNLANVEEYEKYEDYSVTNFGEIISHKRKKDRVLKPGDNGRGYLGVVLSLNGNLKFTKIHRLVAKAFCKGYSPKLEVNHIDENKTNNNYKNLEWVTHKQNMNCGTRNKRISKANNKSVAQLTLKGELVKIWESAKQAECKGGFTRQNISAACLGKTKTSKGFKWRFADLVVSKEHRKSRA